MSGMASPPFCAVEFLPASPHKTHDCGDSPPAFLPPFLKVKTDGEITGGIPLDKSTPSGIVPSFELLPEVGETPVQLSQFVQTLQRTAPAGNPVEDLIQAAPIKAPRS